MSSFFISCAKGLEYLLVDEISALGVPSAKAARAGVTVEGTLHHAQDIVLWSRLASRVVWPIHTFKCTDAHELYAGACMVDWSEHLSSHHSFAIDAHVSGPLLRDARFAAQRVKDAIVDTIRATGQERPNVDVKNPDIRLHLVVRTEQATLSIDVSHGAMHHRGWRGQWHAAPLKETLAAAILLRAQWPTIYAQGGALMDPMCGSGTLVIEGALMAADVAPGLLRQQNNDTMHNTYPTRWPGWDNAYWQQVLTQAQERASTGLAHLKSVFYGSDCDSQAIVAAEANAQAAGVSQCMQWRVCDMRNITPCAQKMGVIVCNPPYDERLALDATTYRDLANTLLASCPEWNAAILCGNTEQALATHLRAHRRYSLYNGALACVLIICAPLQQRGTSSTALRSGPDPDKLDSDGQMLANRLRKNIRRLAPWCKKHNVTCYRIYDADLPEYAAAIDIYQHAEKEHSLYLHIQEYAAPKNIPEHTVQRRRKTLIAAAQYVFSLDREHIAYKLRQRAKDGHQYNKTSRHLPEIWVQEQQACLKINLHDYIDTGLFLDHRPLRRRVAQASVGKHFLNLFCYTGSATVLAALGGATSTTSVDLSANYLAWCSENMQKNGQTGSRHRLIQADVMAWLRADTQTYDVIYCDPPTFSNSAKAEDFDIQKHHINLLELALRRLSVQGVLFFSNHFTRFTLDKATLEQSADCTEISASTLDPDFARRPKIHKVWRITHKTPPNKS